MAGIFMATAIRCRKDKYGDISNFFILEGPGNLNPGNFQDLSQTDPNLRIPTELKTYIARQFKYVLFDQESFSDRDGRNGPAATAIPPRSRIPHEQESRYRRAALLLLHAYSSQTSLVRIGSGIMVSASERSKPRGILIPWMHRTAIT